LELHTSVFCRRGEETLGIQISGLYEENFQKLGRGRRRKKGRERRKGRGKCCVKGMEK